MSIKSKQLWSKKKKNFYLKLTKVFKFTILKPLNMFHNQFRSVQLSVTSKKGLNRFVIAGKHEAEMARKMKSEADQKYLMMKDRQKVTEDDLAKTKVRLEKAQREVSSLDQRLGRAQEENILLRKKAGTQVIYRYETKNKCEN